VLFDANLYVSLLLSPQRGTSPIEKLFARAAAGEFVLVFPLEVLDEVMSSVRRKPYLKARVSEQTVSLLGETLHAFAEIHQGPPSVELKMVRDPADDYLLAHAIEKEIDVLVTGDRDVLVLGALLAPLRMLTPQAFLQELEAGEG
jgi:putative PIN family toxin of toxin-antitoxin system